MRGIVEIVSSLRMLSLLGLLMLATGCASMCDSQFDNDFHAFGGMRDRHDRTNGRVGSIFDPASAQPSIVPPLQPLADVEDRPNLSDDDEDDSGEGDTDDDSSEGGDLKDRLLDELDELDDLPDLPGEDGSDEIGAEV